MLAKYERHTATVQWLSLIARKPKQPLASVGGELHEMLMRETHTENPFLLQRVMHGLIGYCGREIQDALLSV